MSQRLEGLIERYFEADAVYSRGRHARSFERALEWRFLDRARQVGESHLRKLLQ